MSPGIAANRTQVRADDSRSANSRCFVQATKAKVGELLFGVL